MKKNVYLVCCGDIDNGKNPNLSPRGKTQIYNLKHILSKINFDMVFISPLNSAIETYKILSPKNKYIEVSYLCREYITKEEYLLNYKTTKEIKTLNRLKIRMEKFLKKIININQNSS